MIYKSHQIQAKEKRKLEQNYIIVIGRKDVCTMCVKGARRGDDMG